jgi:ribosome assembly protein 1
VYAGNIVGVGGLENYIFKSGTVSSDMDCISFVPVSSQTKSILKVSITTPNFENSHKMLEGLKKLNKSDPSVDVYIEQNGDIVLSTCGEVHL